MMRVPSQLCCLLLFLCGSSGAAWAKPRYFFRITDVKPPPTPEPVVVETARAALQTELANRPEFTGDLNARGDAEIVAALKAQHLEGFNVSVRIQAVTAELQPPKPGGRMKQLAVSVKLSVYGTTLPGEKLAFGGDGEVAVTAEILEKRLDAERRALLTEVTGQAVNQAVNEAVAKLSEPPPAASRKKRHARHP